MVNTSVASQLEGKLTSYISVFDIKDAKNDIVTDTAFDNTWTYLQNRIALGKMYVHWNHYGSPNYISNIGKITAIIKNSRGLVATIQLNDTGKSIMPELYDKYNAGKLFSSIEFTLSPNASIQNINNTRYIINGILLEGIALLENPANKQANVVQFKSDDIKETICNLNPMTEYKSDNEIEIKVNVNNSATTDKEEECDSEDECKEVDISQLNLQETFKCLQASKELVKASNNITEEEKALFINRINRLRKNLSKNNCSENEVEMKGCGNSKKITKDCGKRKMNKGCSKKKMTKGCQKKSVETKSENNFNKTLDNTKNVCHTLNTGNVPLPTDNNSTADSGHTAVPSSSRDAVLKVHPLTALSKFYKK
jgi:HK97 family phage prohead protease